jgi:hypothetical protein
MGGSTPLRHLGAKMLVGQKRPGEQGAIGFGRLRKAGHMTARGLYAARQIISCQAGAIHT